MAPLDFLKAAMKDVRVGALSVSSRFTVERVVSQIPHGAKYVVEYGAGEGAITRAILDRLPKDGKLVAIEVNKDMLEDLALLHDERLTVVRGDVLSLSKTLRNLGLPEVHVAISGIPLSFLTPKMRKDLIHNTHQGLSQDGRFIVYQYSLLSLGLLKKEFKKTHVYFEPRNFFPYFIMTADK